MGRRTLSPEFFQKRNYEDLLMYLTESIHTQDEKDQVIEYLSMNFKKDNNLLDPLNLVPSPHESINNFGWPERYGSKTKLMDIIQDLVSGQLDKEDNVQVYNFFYRNFKTSTEILDDIYTKIESSLLPKDEEDKKKFAVLMALSLAQKLTNAVQEGTMNSDLNIKFLSNQILDEFIEFEKIRQRLRSKIK